MWLPQISGLFDGVKSRHANVEKIKTIGDCYIMAGGVPVRSRPAHLTPSDPPPDPTTSHATGYSSPFHRFTPGSALRRRIFQRVLSPQVICEGAVEENVLSTTMCISPLHSET